MRRFLSLILFAAILVGCAPAQTPQAPTATLQGIKTRPTSTPLPLSINPLLPTATLERWTPAPMPTETASASEISANNANNLKLTKELGTGEITQAVISPDNTRLLVLMSGGLRMYDLESGKNLWTVNSPRIYQQVAFTEDGKNFNTMTSGGLMQTWDAAKGSAGKVLGEAQKNIL
jgi:WD40 repeat protein